MTSLENNRISMYSGSIYDPSINFSTRGSSLQHKDRIVNDCPSFSLGLEFKNVNSPATPVLMDAPTPPNQHASFKQMMNQPNDARTSTGTDHFPSIRSREYQSAMISEHSTSLVQKIDFFSNVNDNSPTKQPRGLSNTNWSSQKPKSGSHNGMLDHTGRESVGSEGVHFNRDSTYGLCFNERMFRPESLKHVQSDNMYTPSDQVLQNSNTMNYGYSTQIQNSHTPMTQKNTLTSSNHPSGRIELSNQQQSSLPPMQKKQSETFVAASTLEPTFIQQHASPKGMSSSKQIVFSTTVEDELFKLLTSNINDIVYGCRIFQIEERWADERTLARCMSNGGYINDFVMNAFIKMFLFDQKMKDQRREKIACLKHITFTEISNELPDPDLFKLKHGRTFWELADHDTSFNTLFNHGMVSDSRFLMDIAIRECSAVFLGIRSLVDVAGGHGGAAQAIAKAFPDSKRSVLDLEHVVTKAPTGTAVDYIVGDMFESVPPADAVFLKWIMHDWSDEDCIKILKKLQKSYRPKRCRREGDNHRHGGWSRAARLEAQRDIGYVRFVHHVRKWRRAR